MGPAAGSRAAKQGEGSGARGAAQPGAGPAPRKRVSLTAKVKGSWSKEEDNKLIDLVHRLGEGNWSQIARALNEANGKAASNGRIGKQCRERWGHHLRPDIKKDAWTHEEEELLAQAHKVHGNRWALIAQSIAGRSENAVKNHWNATLRRRDAPGQHPSPLKRYMAELDLKPSPGGGSKGAGAAAGRARRGGAVAGGVAKRSGRAAARRSAQDEFSSGTTTEEEVEEEEEEEEPEEGPGPKGAGAAAAGLVASLGGASPLSALPWPLSGFGLALPDLTQSSLWAALGGEPAAAAAPAAPAAGPSLYSPLPHRSHSYSDVAAAAAAAASMQHEAALHRLSALSRVHSQPQLQQRAATPPQQPRQRMPQQAGRLSAALALGAPSPVPAPTPLPLSWPAWPFDACKHEGTAPGGCHSTQPRLDLGAGEGAGGWAARGGQDAPGQGAGGRAAANGSPVAAGAAGAGGGAPAGASEGGKGESDDLLIHGAGGAVVDAAGGLDQEESDDNNSMAATSALAPGSTCAGSQASSRPVASPPRLAPPCTQQQLLGAMGYRCGSDGSLQSSGAHVSSIAGHPAPPGAAPGLLGGAGAAGGPLVELGAVGAPCEAAAHEDHDVHYTSSHHGCHVLVTTHPLPPLDALLQQHGGPRVSHLEAGFIIKLGSTGPVRVCLPALASYLLAPHEQPHCHHHPRMHKCGSAPAGLAGFGAPPHPRLHELRTTHGAVRGLVEALVRVCESARAAAAATARAQGIALPFTALLAVRLGSDTPAHEHSVLLGLDGGDADSSLAAVSVFKDKLGPLFC